ncbi:MAG: Asp-tRNA(Asn)/Glu-tRNA(Gln) amidotransferase subunit GatB [Chloroflexota bacterium]|nr:Asp-tRNA(Asn)/Glu-tRNA(Gln) amidotransferase subunit GatB [Chloroflexota bacterium]
MSFEPIIGLEVHVQLNTNSKMFCSCSGSYQEMEPNSLVCEVCLGLPGSLPSVNLEAVKSAIKLGLSLGCNISDITKFDRKNYVYPDLMKGYQISQFDMPIAKNGEINIETKSSEIKSRIRINRVHMEEDVAKLIHNELNDSVFMDLNRSGMPLLEVVTEPDFRSSEEAESYLIKLQSIVRYLGIGKANMEEGSFRCDANVSIREKGSEKLNEKVEIKNMNRIKAVARAIDYEIARQEKAMNNGDRIIQETRGWDDIESKSIPQRSKEDAHDYRYFAEPDIPAIKITEKFINSLKESLPELPEEKQERYENDLNLSSYDAGILVSNQKKADFFDKVIDSSNQLDGKYVANWINVDLNAISNAQKDDELEKMKISPENFGKLITLVKENKINKNTAKDLLSEIYLSNEDAESLSKSRGLQKIEDSGQLSDIVRNAIESNQAAVDDYKNGKETAVRFLIGQVMKQSKGTANPNSAETEIIKQLKNE